MPHRGSETPHSVLQHDNRIWRAVIYTDFDEVSAVIEARGQRRAERALRQWLARQQRDGAELREKLPGVATETVYVLDFHGQTLYAKVVPPSEWHEWLEYQADAPARRIGHAVGQRLEYGVVR